MSLTIKKVDEEIERQSLLKHPFYQKWSRGELTLGELSGYSREYFQLVKAVPGLVSQVEALAPSQSQKAQIHENVEEERSHVEPWVRFAGALGVQRADLEGHKGSKLTLSATSELERLTASSYIEGVAALYAYESQLPKISRSKIDGLEKFYGFKGGDATKYFEIHEEADVRHAAVWRAVLESEGVPEERVIRATRESMGAQNRLLDSVVSGYCPN